MDTRDELAAKRFWAMQMVRLSGLTLALLGVVTIAGVVDLPQAVGGILLVLGAVDFFAVPLFLARRWKSPE